MKRVNYLLRVSSKQQLYGDDIPIQRKECQKYLSVHSDWAFQKEYVEKAVSGFKTSIKDRDILKEILEDARGKRFDVLLVYMSDRIGRKEDESPVFVTTLNNLGIEVWSVREGQLRTAEHIDKLLNYIRFWQAEGESRKTGMRVKDAQETLVRAGKFVGGRAPFGYDLIYSGVVSNHGRALKHLVIDPKTASIVKKIFEYSIYYNYGNLKIARLLNEKGVSAPKDTWKASTIAQILQNPVYMGYIAYNRRSRNACDGSTKRISMEHWVLSEKQIPELVIISKETWYKAQEMRERRKAMAERETGRKNVPVSSNGHLALMGLVYCGYCGCRLTNGSKYDYWTTKGGEKKKKFVGRYKCSCRANGSLTCGKRTYYKAEELEMMIYSIVFSYLGQLKAHDLSEDIVKLQEEQKKIVMQEKDVLQKEIETVKKDIEILQQHIPAALRGEGVFGPEQLSSLINNKKLRLLELNQLKESRKYEIDRRKKIDLGDKKPVLSDWREVFLSCSMPEQKVILAELIERIEVMEEDIRISLKISAEEYGEILPRMTAGFAVSQQGL